MGNLLSNWERERERDDGADGERAPKRRRRESTTCPGLSIGTGSGATYDPMVRNAYLFNRDVRSDIGAFLSPGDLVNTQNASRVMRDDSDGANLRMFFTPEHIDKMIDRISKPNNGLESTSFEIRVFDGAIQKRFDNLCQYVSRLKINFRFKTGLRYSTDIFDGTPVVTDHDQAEFTEVVTRALGSLKNATRMRSLELDFHTDATAADYRWLPRAKVTRQVIHALAMLKHTPSLCELRINLTANAIDDDDCHALASLNKSVTLHTLSLELGQNPEIGPVGVSALGQLGRSPVLRHLGLRFSKIEISDMGIEALCNELKSSIALEQIHIRVDIYNRNNDARVVRAFATLKQIPTLRTLGLTIITSGYLPLCDVAKKTLMRLAMQRPRELDGAPGTPWALSVSTSQSDMNSIGV